MQSNRVGMVFGLSAARVHHRHLPSSTFNKGTPIQWLSLPCFFTSTCLARHPQVAPPLTMAPLLYAVPLGCIIVHIKGLDLYRVHGKPIQLPGQAVAAALGSTPMFPEQAP